MSEEPQSRGERPASAGEKTARAANGQFVKGRVGNAKGRTQGSRNKATLACEALLDASGKRLTKLCVERAEAGDPTALKLCLDRHPSHFHVGD
jgi:hypothetical protein